MIAADSSPHPRRPHPCRPHPRRLDRRAALRVGGGAVGAVLLGVSGLAACTPGGVAPAEAADSSEAPGATGTVTRRDLATTESFDGTLGFGTERSLASGRPGTITKVPGIGDVIEPGGELWRVDGSPVVLFAGDTPFWRDLSTSATDNVDVAILKRNLENLGYFDGLLFNDDDTYDAATALAVSAWQTALGLTATGTFALGSAVVAPGAVRVANVKIAPGSPAQGDVLAVTGIDRLVAVELEAEERSKLPEGSAVVVRLPGSKKAAGTVTEVGRTATAGSSDGPGGDADPTIEVKVAIDDPAAVGDLDSAPVKVDIVTEEVKGVLAVPVGSLVALREGGLAVELVDGSSRQYVAVKTGMYADGWVQVEGDLNEGEKVVTVR